MPSLRETLKELYDGIMEEARTNLPTMSGPVVPTSAQAEAARLYAAAVAKAAGTTVSTSVARAPVLAARLIIPAAGSTMAAASQPTDVLDEVSTTSAAAEASDQPRGMEVLRALSTLHPDQLAQGIVLAEVLGKPLSRRRYPGR